MAIDIGSVVEDRDSRWAYGSSVIVKENPANASGRITSVDIWMESTGSVKVATFYREDSDNFPNYFTARDSQNIGSVSSGAKRTIPVDLEVEAGDFIGCWIWSPGEIEADTEGEEGIWQRAGDIYTWENEEFAFTAGHTISLGASGFEPTTPTVTTQAASGIKNVYCTGNGNITNEGYANITERGFEYGLAEEAQFSVKQTGADLGGGAYTLTVTGLDPSTTYYYRAYATNSEGVGYGSWVEFSTVASPDYGMYEEDNAATLCFYVRRFGGKWSKKYGPYTTDQSDISITDVLTEGKGKYQIKFESDSLTGISAGVMCKVDIKAR